MRVGDMQGMQYLVNQLKKYRMNEGGPDGFGFSSSLYSPTGAAGGLSSAFLSPMNLTMTNPMMTTTSANRQNN